jgi:hypothetical protein
VADPSPAESPDLVPLLRAGKAPPEIRRFAARGLLPLDAVGQTQALLAVLEDAEPEIAETAKATFAGVVPEDLGRFVEQSDPTGVELDAIARHCQDAYVLERVVRHRNVDDHTLLHMARSATGAPQDSLVVNQVRLLRLPALIDALFENPELTAESRRLLNEIREEFFEKKIRRKEAAEEEARRLAEEAAPAADLEAEEEGEEALEEGAGAAPAEGEAEVDQLTTGALYRRIGVMTVQEKIQLAFAGGKEERRILIGDSNSLVGQAVLKARGLTPNEVESFSAMRHLDAEIFRRIAANREWMRKVPIVTALVKNPAVPIAIALPLVKHLAIRELKAVTRDPNLSEGVRLTAKKLLLEKRH